MTAPVGKAVLAQSGQASRAVEVAESTTVVPSHHELTEQVRARSSTERLPVSDKQSSDKQSRYMYRDYSRIRPTIESIFVQQHQQQQIDPSSVRIQKLPAKLHSMLCNPEIQHIISWMPHGRAFKVHNSHLFVEHVMSRFFEYSNYNSFIRLVNAWGFRRLTKGPDRNAYWHEVRTQISISVILACILHLTAHKSVSLLISIVRA